MNLEDDKTLEPWPEWAEDAARVLRQSLPSIEMLRLTRVDPREFYSQTLRSLRIAAREEERECRRRALEETLRAETLADIRRRS